MKSNCFTLLLVIMLALVSCGVDHYVSIVKSTPPDITFSHNETILVVNTFNFEQLGLKSAKKLTVIKGGAYVSINYAANKLKSLPGVKVINLVDSSNVCLSVDSLNAWALKYNADYILALRKFDAYFDADNIVSYTDDNNKKAKVTTADYNLKVIANYTLYNKDGSVYKQLEALTNDYKETRQIPGALLAPLMSPWVKNNSVTINQSAIHATDIALQTFFPLIATVNRPLYYNGDLKEAVNEINSNNFNRADSLLRLLLNNDDNSLAAKAAYNLAVIYEAKGDLKVATDMLQLSLEKQENTKAQMLLSELNITVTASR